ncbi:MAG: hypothetical protein R3F11_15560 [Verrucomicrobiales bacterium]
MSDDPGSEVRKAKLSCAFLALLFLAVSGALYWVLFGVPNREAHRLAERIEAVPAAEWSAFYAGCARWLGEADSADPDGASAPVVEDLPPLLRDLGFERPHVLAGNAVVQARQDFGKDGPAVWLFVYIGSDQQEDGIWLRGGGRDGYVYRAPNEGLQAR